MTDITLPRAELEQWLVALLFVNWSELYKVEGVITALRERLAQPGQQDCWQEEARRYAQNAEFWRGKYESAIAQRTEQEPVAWLSWNDKDGYGYWDTKAEADLNCAGDTEPEPLYTSPPQRKPLPLKEVERLIYKNTKINPNVADDRELLGYIVNAARSIEAAHGIGDGQ